MQALSEELKEDARKPNIHLTTIYPFIVNTGQVQRPRLRFPKLLGVQKPNHAAEMIIKAIRQNKFEASVPRWLLPLHDIARYDRLVISIPVTLLIPYFIQGFASRDV